MLHACTSHSQNPAATELLLKVALGDDLRRLRINPTPHVGRFDELSAAVMVLFGAASRPYHLSWIDDEGDSISVCTDSELDEAIASASGTVRLSATEIEPADVVCSAPPHTQVNANSMFKAPDRSVLRSSSPVYSSAKCIASNVVGTGSAARSRMCHLKNVCYNATASVTGQRVQLLYFAAPADSTNAADISVDLCPSGNRISKIRAPYVGGVCYSADVTVVQSTAVPTQAIWAPVESDDFSGHGRAQHVHVDLRPKFLDQYGHALLDNAFAIWNQLNYFVPEAAVVPNATASDSHDRHAQAPVTILLHDTKTQKHHNDWFLQQLGFASVGTVGKFIERAAQGRSTPGAKMGDVVCVRSLLRGAGDQGLVPFRRVRDWPWSGKERRVLGYLSYLRSCVGDHAPWATVKGLPGVTVLLANRSKSRRLLNIAELREELVRRYVIVTPLRLYGMCACSYKL